MRVLALIASTAACALVSGLIALWAHGESLPPTDGAYGMTLRESLNDPFVLYAWSMYVLLAGLVGLVFALLLLRKVDLRKAIPVVFLVTVFFTGITAPLFSMLSALFGLGAGLAAMLWCWDRSSWRIQQERT